MTDRPDALVVGERPLTADDVHAVAVAGAPVGLSAAVTERLTVEREVVDAAVRQQLPIYGVNTGLGARSHLPLDAAELRTMSLRTVRGRACATGDPLPTEVVRAAMLARLAGFARGGSGVRTEVAAAVLALLTHRVHPVVPSTGSLGSSDLVQMAHVALVLVGEGRAEVDGRVLDGADALQSAGLQALLLEPKEGLALCTGSPLAAGVAALAVHELVAAQRVGAAVIVTTFEAWRAATGVLDDRVLALRPQPGQAEAASLLRGALQGSRLLAVDTPRRLQDPVSIRAAPSVLGSLVAATETLRQVTVDELNGSGDNPVVLDGAVVPTGNFHTPYLAVCLDAAALAVAQSASCSVARLARLLEPTLSGLPLNLSRHTAHASGMAPLLKVAQAVVVRLRHAAAPMSLDPRTGAAGVEDDATNAALSAERLRQVLRWHHRVLAIEALAAVQGIDLLAEPVRLGDGVERLRRAVRAVSAPLDEDRSMSADIEAVDQVLADL
ncbi:MAG: aromatic amino acid lyase [Actinomycetota bacterium]|nr:aromatic amino acid lyase [Actinomycetota bacterium]